MVDKLYCIDKIESIATELGWEIVDNYHQVSHSDENGYLSVIKKLNSEGEEERPYRFLVFKKKQRKSETKYDVICINGMASWDFMKKLDPSLFSNRK